MYFLVIRSRGRVPISDGFVARRIAGPGLAANHFFQVMRQFFIIEGDISSFVYCKPTNIAIAMFHKLQSGTIIEGDIISSCIFCKPTTGNIALTLFNKFKSGICCLINICGHQFLAIS